MIPKFAVVGRTNKGKSSIVSSLTENALIAIAPTPRTTQVCQEFLLQADGQELLSIIDTPGFEEAPAVLEWLQLEDVSAHKRTERVIAFLNEFADGDRFRFERNLLTPIMNGAAILYVADASKPYRSHYECEFEILRWTGQPSMALVNQIGSSDYSEEWIAALNQYFKKVTRFNAHKSYFMDRLNLLDQLRVIHESVGPAIERAIEVLKRQQDLRIQNSRAILADFLIDALNYQVKTELKSDRSQESQKEDLLKLYKDKLEAKENQARKKIQELFNYSHLSRQQSSIKKAVYDQELFSRESFETLGLSRRKLITAGAAAGAIAGGSLDVMLGGASVLAGTGLGAILGGGSSAYISFTKKEIAGIKVQQAKLIVGPNRNPNFPWVLLDRNLIFMQAILNRTHAMHDDIVLRSEEEGPMLIDSLPHTLIVEMSRIFKQARWKAPPYKLSEELAEAIGKIFTIQNLY